MSTARGRRDAPYFTGMALDRASEQRKDPEWVTRLFRDPGSRAVLAGHDVISIRDGEEPQVLRVAMPGSGPDEPILLGLDGAGAGLFALDLDQHPAGSVVPDDGGDVVSLREAGARLGNPGPGWPGPPSFPVPGPPGRPSARGLR